MRELPAPLAAMSQYPQFILWKLIHTPGKPKPDKVPVNADGRPIDPHFAGNQMTAADALALAAATGYGLGFVFTERDPFFFLDLDASLSADGWSPRALDMCTRFQGAAVEISQSGQGLHIFGCGTPPPHGTKNAAEHLELYTSLRFVALTGAGAIGDIWTDHTAALQAVCAEFFPPRSDSPADAEWTTAPRADWDGYADDQQLIAAAMRSKSAGSVFGAKASFAELWEGDPDTLGKYFPDGGGRAFDASSADAALCQHLAFWTGCDCERIDRLVRASGLMREKWEDRPDYRQRTILGAVARCKDVYAKPKQSVWEEPKPPAPPTPPALPVPAGSAPSTGYYMQPHEQLEHFKGCVYVRGMHRVFTPDGALLQPQQFKSAYGGKYFITDPVANKGVKNAFEAFTENGTYRPPTAHSICFRPDLPPASIITEEGSTRLNVYVPIETPCVPGDISMFEYHLSKLLPDARDRAIITSYMAAMVQHPGAKFQWAPLIQGAAGNGKTALAHIIKHAVGARYYHVPNAQDITNKFNGWLVGKLAIAIEEIKIADKWEALEILKPLITNSDIEIQAKGQDQVLGDNRANFILCTNHMDALRVTKDDRRYCVFYTAQQTADDLVRDELGGDFFPRYYKWLRLEGYAALTHYLKNFPIPDEFNPAENCHRAPTTTSTVHAIKMSASPVEQEIQAAIDEERPGFRGGWISSIKLDALLGQLRYKVARNTRRTILEGMGFYAHPALPGGKASRMVMEEAGRPILYVRPDGPHWGLTDAHAVTAAYTATLVGEWGK